MKITIIVCTFNRCESLAKTLGSISALTDPQGAEWEVLVVDNRSNDRTSAVVADFCSRHPGRFRYLFEPQPGKAYAMNAGIREATGAILAFTDDDVIVEPTWLQNLTAGLRSGECTGAGGRVIPAWPRSLPPWVSIDSPHARGPLPFFDCGHEACELTEPPIGANAAFRKVVFEKYGGYRTDLGPSPDSKIPHTNDDIEFGQRLMDAGERLRYEPLAVVYHAVGPDRINKKYFLKWWFEKGQADIRTDRMRPDAKCYRDISLRRIANLALWTLRWMMSVKPLMRFYHKTLVWQKLGAIVECYRQSLEAKTQKACKGTDCKDIRVS